MPVHGVRLDAEWKELHKRECAGEVEPASVSGLMSGDPDRRISERCRRCTSQRSRSALGSPPDNCLRIPISKRG